MFAYPIIVAAMIGSGLLIGWIDFSYLWGMIPAVIGGFCGSYYSKFGRMLLKPGIVTTKEKRSSPSHAF